jgi:nitroreductase
MSMERSTAMDVTEALHQRRTVRAFLRRPVPRETLETILEASLRTPSWANTQPWEIYVAGGHVLDRIRDISVQRTRDKVPGTPDLKMPGGWPEECRGRTKELTAGRAVVAGTAVDDPAFQRAFVEANRRFFDAPCVVYLCMDRRLGHWSVYDLGAMSQSIMLAALEQGVDSAVAINMVVYPDVIREELDIPDHMQIVIGIGLGYVDESGPEDAFRSERRALEEVVRFFGL